MASRGRVGSEQGRQQGVIDVVDRGAGSMKMLLRRWRRLVPRAPATAAMSKGEILEVARVFRRWLRGSFSGRARVYGGPGCRGRRWDRPRHGDACRHRTAWCGARVCGVGLGG
jgi:hypothetical protein